MRTVEHDGVHIEQCSQCRGIFLDRGELEHIASAEQRHYGGVPSYGGGGFRPDSPGPYGRGHRPDSPGPFGHGHRPDSPGSYRQGHYPDSPGPHGRRRKRSFMEGLFD